MLLMHGMLVALLKNESAPEPFSDAPPASMTINRAFVTWWKVNGPRIAAKENKEGFQNAKGWKSNWVSDRQRLREN